MYTNAHCQYIHVYIYRKDLLQHICLQRHSVCVWVCMCVCVCEYMRVYTHTANDSVCKHVLYAFAVYIHMYLFAMYIYLQCIFICNVYLFALRAYAQMYLLRV